MMSTFTLYAALSPLVCAFVGAGVAHSQDAGPWTVILFAIIGLILGGAAGAY